MSLWDFVAIVREMEKKSLGIYLHIPFCRSRCIYCDFVSSVGDEKNMDDYVRRLIREIELAGKEYSDAYKVDTVYIGGGTPSLLPERHLLEISRALFDNFDTNVQEFTAEANPCTVDIGKLDALYRSGANRLSIGVQTFDDGLLKMLGRRHDSKSAERAIELAVKRGFDVSADLMIGLPDQTFGDVSRSIDRADALGVEHISVYMLSVEEGTKLDNLIKNGVLIAKSEDESADFYDFACEELKKRGFDRYEVSNFCKGGKYSRHNMRYWRRADYLGLGISAHSLMEGRRWRNCRDFDGYYKSIDEDRLQRLDIEVLDADGEKNETVMLALRLKDGIDVGAYKAKFGSDVFDEYAVALQKNAKYLDIFPDRVSIKDEYLKVMNSIAVDFLK